MSQTSGLYSANGIIFCSAADHSGFNRRGETPLHTARRFTHILNQP